MNRKLTETGRRAKAAAGILATAKDGDINACLSAAARAITDNADIILAANAADISGAEKKGVSPALIDRLRLDYARLEGVSEGLIQIAGLKTPVGETVYRYVKDNGLDITEKRVPFGVIGIIYESRPNVTADAFGLCFKTANAVILRGGSDALNSNRAITEALRGALVKCGFPADAVQLIENVSRETAEDFMRLDEYVDLLIPRGGAGLIKTVTQTATIPVIETGTATAIFTWTNLPIQKRR